MVFSWQTICLSAEYHLIDKYFDEQAFETMGIWSMDILFIGIWLTNIWMTDNSIERQQDYGKCVSIYLTNWYLADRLTSIFRRSFHCRNLPIDIQLTRQFNNKHFDGRHLNHGHLACRNLTNGYRHLNVRHLMAGRLNHRHFVHRPFASCYLDIWITDISINIHLNHRHFN